MRLLLAPLLAAAAVLAAAPRADACGCFVPPDGVVPVVQAGERLLFAREQGQVVAHIQIQFAGAAGDFGWLLPLPSIPDLELGSDEVFTQLAAATQPQYLLTRELEDCDNGSAEGCNRGCGGQADSGFGDPFGRPLPDAGGGPAVLQDTIGPYDYAVLRADSKREMLDWLAANRYFVPAGTDDAVAPYIRPDAYFLALKLRPGKSTGDLQPVVVRYESDLPMIPIVLTSVAALPDMGIAVYILGRGRAVPRNFAHTVLNDAAIDWAGGARNYNDVVVRATREAEGRHTFITEYAGSSRIMAGRFGTQLRFGSRDGLADQQGLDALVAYLNRNDYIAGPRPVPSARPSYSSQLTAILSAYAPMPRELADRGVVPAQFYPALQTYRYQFPAILAEWQPSYDARALADEIWERIAMPTRAAAKLFDDHPYLTRLYTTLSPQDMTRDPVFSENAKLPDVSNIHNGRAIFRCGGEPLSLVTPVTVVTEQGRRIDYPNGLMQPVSFTTPGSLRIEILPDEGAPRTVLDNSTTIPGTLPSDLGDGGGCALARGRSFSAALLLLFCAARLWRRRRRGGI